MGLLHIFFIEIFYQMHINYSIY